MIKQYESALAVFEAHWHNPHTEPYYRTYRWVNGIPYFGIYSLVDVDNFNSRTKVTIDFKEGTMKVESLGELPQSYTETL